MSPTNVATNIHHAAAVQTPGLRNRPSRWPLACRSLAQMSLACTALAGLLLAHPAHAQTVFTAQGDAAALLPTVDMFRSALGPLNGNLPQVFANGRREINWDAVPDGFADPNAFPGGFFNGSTPGRARGVVFSTPGSGFAVSADASNPSSRTPNFGFGAQLQPFSAERMFSPLGSTITDVRFFSPADQTTAATTRGFGVVFEDVQSYGATALDFYGLNGNLLAHVPALAGASGSLSFAGALFSSAVVGSVRITSGSAALLGNGLAQAVGDLVVMDDFIFAEAQPVPEPQTWVLLVAGLGLLGAARRRASRR